MKLERRYGPLLISIAILVLVTAGPAQAGTTGQLGGSVVDEGGSPLPAVRVSAGSPAQIGGVRVGETDARGLFLYPRLAPGNYTVTIELEGYVTQELTEVQVRLDRLTDLRVTLPRATFEDEVKVVETTPVVDPEQTSNGQVFTSEYLQQAALGMDNRHYLRVLPQTAGVESGGLYGVKVLGSTEFENVYRVDGMDTTDPYDQLISLSLTFEAVDEIAFHTSNFDAEYGLATGGVVNLITKSGGNAFSGSFDFRYQDSDLAAAGDHLDPEEEPFETWDLNASFGGPVVRDRLWFFTALQSFRDKNTPAGAPATVDWDEKNFLGKLTWQAGSSWSLAAKVLGNPAKIGNSNASQFRAPEANAKEERQMLSGHVELNGVLSDRLLYGLRLGGQAASADHVPNNGDLSTIGHGNLVTGEAYGAYSVQSFDHRERTEIETDLTWFVDAFGGSHDVKGGLRYAGTGYTSNFCRTGSGRDCTVGEEGYLFLDVVDATDAPIPFRFFVQEAGGPQDFSGSIQSVYLQDAWGIRSDLTLKVGLRWDRAQQDNDVGQEIADLAMLQPRLGLAWDIRGNGRNILRTSWGQYMHPSSLHIAEFSAEKSTPGAFWLSCSLFISAEPGECSAAAPAFGFGYRTDPEGWDPAGWFLDPELVFFSVPNRTAPGLEPMYADELLVSFERELFRRTALELSYVKKETHNLIEDTCNGNVPTPTADAACDHFVVANIPGARRNYEGWLLRFETRALNRLHIISSYVYSESKGSLGGWDITAAFDVYPYNYVNTYGYLPDHSRHRLKVNGFVQFPYDLTLGIGGYWSSEFRWTPTDLNIPDQPFGVMLVEPRGNRKEDGRSQLDLQLSKGFRVGATRFALIGTVYNVLNSEAAIAVCESVSGCGQLEMGEPIAWQLPRRYELGVRVQF